MKQLKVIIPARGGSKGLPGKNIKELNGLPLIAYPILASKKSNLISDIYVSTDDDKIKIQALKYGATVIDRPTHLAEDTSLDIDVMKHAVKYLDNYEDIVHLRATTPIVEPNILDDAIRFYHKNIQCTSLRSGHEMSETAYKCFKLNNIYWSGLFNNEYNDDYYNWPRQQLPKTYQTNGYIDIIKPSQFMNTNSIHGNKILAFITPYAHEIDTLDDFKILKNMYDKNKK